MGALKCVARAKKPAREVDLNDDVLDMSLTIGLKGVDVCKTNIEKLNRVLEEHYIAGLVALERGDIENRLHFQMVCRARIKSSLSFGILVCKHMGWYGVENMNPPNCICCKSLTNIGLHTFHDILGYCLKDTGAEHFDVAMKNISDEDIMEGKMLYAKYGPLDLKFKVVLTHKNVIDCMYMWHKYKTNRQVTTTLCLY